MIQNAIYFVRDRFARLILFYELTFGAVHLCMCVNRVNMISKPFPKFQRVCKTDNDFIDCRHFKQKFIYIFCIYLVFIEIITKNKIFNYLSYFIC